MYGMLPGQPQTVDTFSPVTLFDWNSITIPLPTKYLNPGAQLYTVIGAATMNTITNGVPQINQPVSIINIAQNLAQLSQNDCRGLQAIYSSLRCQNVQCRDRNL